MDIPQRHDKLFKIAFGDPTNAAGLLQAELPPALSEAIDWPSLRQEQGSFVDSQYQSSHADLLFSGKVKGRDMLLYILFEHQSTPDHRMFFRLLRYMSRIWEDQHRRLAGSHRSHKLPPILPVVLFQNAEVWDMPASLADLLEMPPGLEDDLLPFIPDFVCRQLQLAGMDYEDIPGTSAGILVLRAMKAERLGALLDPPLWQEELILGVPTEIFLLVLGYMLGADIDKTAFEAKIREIRDPALRDKAMSLAQVYRQEGRQEGREEGQVLALREAVLDLLQERFEKIPEGLVATVEEMQDTNELRALLRRAFSCTDLQDFAKGL